MVGARMRAVVCLAALLSTGAAWAQAGPEADPLLPNQPAPPPPAPNPLLPQPPPPAPPAPTAPTGPLLPNDPPPPTSVAPKEPPNAKSWDEYDDVEVPGATQEEAPKAKKRAPALGSLTWREIPWGVASQAGLATFGFLVAWQLFSIPLAFIPCVGTFSGAVGVLLPVIAPFVGWMWATQYRNVRAPLITSLLSGLVWWLTGLACLPPTLCLTLTPLAPCAVIGLFAVQGGAVSAANAFFLRRFGRLRIPGEKIWNYDMLSTPVPGSSDDIEDEPKRSGKRRVK